MSLNMQQFIKSTCMMPTTIVHIVNQFSRFKHAHNNISLNLQQFIKSQSSCWYQFSIFKNYSLGFLCLKSSLYTNFPNLFLSPLKSPHVTYRFLAPEVLLNLYYNFLRTKIQLFYYNYFQSVEQNCFRIYLCNLMTFHF